MGRFSFSFLSMLAAVMVVFPIVTALPLSTNSRWIVDEAGQRVKLACVNWVSHLDAVVAEGLSKQPVGVISKKILSMGFNCVRLTWPLYLVTNDSLASLTVRQSFQNLGLLESIAGIQANNPSIIDLPLIKAYQAVVANLGDNDLMVILDNHITQPKWCCSNFDGNGFFGDKYFDPGLWIKGLTSMATLFSGVINVVGMSLRNELRGPKQNVKAWYRYMQQGAEAVYAANPDVLVILSGLSYDRDLSFLQNKPLNLTFNGKVVYEMHWYGFSDGSAWVSGNPNQVCGQVINNMMRMSGFLLEQGWPLFVSEFGGDLRGTNVNDNRYLNCFTAMAAELDLDWALWTLVGSYYLREGVIGLNEYYGILNWNWCDIRNSSFLQRISALQSPFQGPGLSEARPHKVIFHPSTGLCLLRKSFLDPLRLGPCTKSDGWSYTPQKVLSLKGTYFCIQANELGKQARLGITCKCLRRDHTCDPGSQWFKLVDSTRRSTSTKSLIRDYSILNLPGKDFMPMYLRSA